MTLYKLSFKNIRRSMKDYAIYFFTLIVGIAVFYVFNAIETQTAMLSVSKRNIEIIELLNNMLSGVSVFVSIILGFLIIYANGFLMRRRKKEFGVYMTLGMGKWKISMVLFLETLMIGILSLACGLFVGTGASQLMSMFVANLFEADMTEFTFIFSKSACGKTVLYFAMMYGVVILFNAVMVGRYRLIDLLQANKMSERVKLKNPWLCTVVFLIAAGILAKAYYMVTAGMPDMENYKEIYVAIGLGMVGTFLIFWSVSGLLLRVCMSMKGLYFRGLNCFTLRQLSSRINTMVLSMTVICLMLFVTICVLSSSLSVKRSLEIQMRELAPADVEISKYVYVGDTEQGLDITIQHGSSTNSYQMDELDENQAFAASADIEQAYRSCGVDVARYFGESVEFYTYLYPDCTLGALLGDTYMEETGSGLSEMLLPMIKESDYNALAKLYGKETVALRDGSYLLMANYDYMVAEYDKALRDGRTVTAYGKTLTPQEDSCGNGIIEMTANYENEGFLVVPDDFIDEDYVDVDRMQYLIGNYRSGLTDTEKDEAEAIIRLEQATNQRRESGIWGFYFVSVNTRQDIQEASIGLGAIVSFIGLYLGIVFSISSAAILALKELSESADNIERYRTLRMLGTDENMIRKALFLQIGIFFLIPLVLACVHAVFGMKFALYILSTFGKSGLLQSVLTTAGILVVIYGGYFVLTYLCSRSIIE